MGTKNSYSGGGGKAGGDIREGLDEWLAALPGAPLGAPSADTGAPDSGADALRTLRINPKSVAAAAALFQATRGGANTGGGRSRGSAGPARSAAASAGAAGRGAAAAYAYRAGDAETLRELGLDFDELRANPDVVDVAQRIAQAVCQELPPGTIEAEELLIVVGDLAGWVLEAGTPESPPPPQDIAREALARVLAGAYLAETAARLNGAKLSRQERADTEREIRAACEEVAARMDLSPSAPTSRELTDAVENGLPLLRAIYQGTSDAVL